MFNTIFLPAIIIGALGLLFGLGLSIASKKFALSGSDERIDQIVNILPGANCAACGYTGCAAYAAAVVNDNEKCNLCSVGGDEVLKNITEIMGVEESALSRKVARVMCDGHTDAAKLKYDYNGITTCSAATQLHAGHSACRYGCLGFGDCIKACPVDAIALQNGVAKIIPVKCAGCGVCAEICPKGIIKILPADNHHSVICSNTDKGAEVRSICKYGCIGCTKCIKVCEQGAISMSGSLAVIDPEKCTNCGACVGCCPVHAIQEVVYNPCLRIK